MLVSGAFVSPAAQTRAVPACAFVVLRLLRSTLAQLYELLEAGGVLAVDHFKLDGLEGVMVPLLRWLRAQGHDAVLQLRQVRAGRPRPVDNAWCPRDGATSTSEARVCSTHFNALEQTVSCSHGRASRVSGH